MIIAMHTYRVTLAVTVTPTLAERHVTQHDARSHMDACLAAMLEHERAQRLADGDKFKVSAIKIKTALITLN